MPYRIDLRQAGDRAFDLLVDLGALDVEVCRDRSVAALMPDNVEPEEVARALGVADVAVSPATPRDNQSVWILRPRPVRIGRVTIVPHGDEAAPGTIRTVDSAAFGTGLHPTTALCIEELERVVEHSAPESVLDVGTGSGVLVLAALLLGVPRATGIDVDDDALRAAMQNASLNGFDDGCS